MAKSYVLCKCRLQETDWDFQSCRKNPKPRCPDLISLILDVDGLDSIKPI